tara:strand:+ start:13052 stop:13330 length:279 start_codon:yes stop_codon:yes gene_type:complete
MDNLAEYGALGTLCLLLITALSILWKQYQVQIHINQDMGKQMVELATRLTSLLDDTYANVKSMPNDVREKIKPDLDSIKEKTEEIKKLFNES